MNLQVNFLRIPAMLVGVAFIANGAMAMGIFFIVISFIAFVFLGD